jgi:excinuclease ABC subunit C
VTATLRDKVRTGALNRPGVYRMIGASGVVIYVGKSKRLRTRLMGYFRARQHEKAWRILREANGLEWDYAPSEFASLLLELELIKHHRPPYNVRQKRDALYSFLKLTPCPAPRLHVVRRAADDGGTYFGPFPGGSRIVDAVRELNDVMLLRDCRSATPIHFADQEELFGMDRTPLCPRYELRRCCGPCAGLCSEREYDRRVRQARAFLEGDAEEPIRELEARMLAAVERLAFEHAAALRDRVARLEMLRREFLRLREVTQRLSFLYAVPGFDREHRVYAIRSGSIRRVFPAPRTARQRSKLLEDAAEQFRQPESALEVSSRRRVEEVLLVARWFRARPDEHARTYVAERWSELPLSGQLDRLMVA